MKCLTPITVLLLILSASLQGSPVEEFSIWVARLNNCKKAEQLYTPVEVEEYCFRDAQKCFMDGLHILQTKCNDTLEEDYGWDTIDNIRGFLNDAAEEMKTSNSTEGCDCKEKPFKDFKNKLIRWWQQGNSQNRGPSH